MSGESLPASAVLQDIAAQAGVSVSITDDIGKVPITVEFVAVPGQAAFEEVGRLLKRSAAFANGLVSYPETRSTKEAFGVVRSGFVDVKLASEAMKSAVGQSSDVIVVDDRLVVTGSLDAVRRAEELGQQFQTGADGWTLEVKIVQVSESMRRQVGLDWNVSGRLEVGLDAGVGNKSGLAPVLGARAAAAVEVLAQASEQTSDVRVLNTGRLFVMEGGEASMQQGDTTPVPQRTVSPEGTVTTTGFERIKTGFLLKVKAKRVPGGVLLALDPSVSSVTGYVDGAPIVSESTVSSSVVVKDSGWVILSGLQTVESSKDTSGLPGGSDSRLFSKSSTRVSDASVLVLVRADRVYSGSLPAVPSSGVQGPPAR